MKKILAMALIVAAVAGGVYLYTKDDPKTSAPNNQSAVTDDTIDLSGTSLAELSKDLLDNTDVKTLDVSNNNLTGSLPAEIRLLQNLETLNASDNQMTGIPAEIGQLKKLKVANFANNNLSGLPLEIGNLQNLETLDLRGNPNISQYDIGLIKEKIPDTTILTD